MTLRRPSLQAMCSEVLPSCTQLKTMNTRFKYIHTFTSLAGGDTAGCNYWVRSALAS